MIMISLSSPVRIWMAQTTTNGPSLSVLGESGPLLTMGLVDVIAPSSWWAAGRAFGVVRCPFRHRSRPPIVRPSGEIDSVRHPGRRTQLLIAYPTILRRPFLWSDHLTPAIRRSIARCELASFVCVISRTVLLSVVSIRWV